MQNFTTIITGILLVVVYPLYSQSSIEPFNSIIKHEGAERSCIQVNLDPEPKTLKDAWKDYLNDNYDFKLKGIGFLSNKDLLSAEEVKVKPISPKVMDFYTHIVEDDNGSEMKVFARFGYDVYINKSNNPDAFQSINEILKEFLKYYLPKYYKGQINDTVERIEELTDESEDLKDDIADNTKDIEKLKKEIKKLEKHMNENSEKLEIANRKLMKRKEKLTRINKQLKNL